VNFQEIISPFIFKGFNEILIFIASSQTKNDTTCELFMNKMEISIAIKHNSRGESEKLMLSMVKHVRSG